MPRFETRRRCESDIAVQVYSRVGFLRSFYRGSPTTARLDALLHSWITRLDRCAPSALIAENTDERRGDCCSNIILRNFASPEIKLIHCTIPISSYLLAINRCIAIWRLRANYLRSSSRSLDADLSDYRNTHSRQLDKIGDAIEMIEVLSDWLDWPKYDRTVASKNTVRIAARYVYWRIRLTSVLGSMHNISSGQQ